MTGPYNPTTAAATVFVNGNGHDVVPREPQWVSRARPVVAGSSPGAWIDGDVWLERLYAIQWLSGVDLRAGKSRPETWFAVPTAQDLKRETKVTAYVQDHIADWQASGLVPDMRIEPGVEMPFRRSRVGIGQSVRNDCKANSVTQHQRA